MKTKSPYSASFTGGGFILDETIALLPLLQSPDRPSLIKEERIHNRLLQINSETARKRIIAEVCKRYDAMPESFWNDFYIMSYADKLVANFFVILKCYKTVFDFHVNVTMRKWNSISKSVTIDDIDMEMNELSAKDSFVDSWSDKTKQKVESTYLTILRKVGMLDSENNLSAIKASNFGYYILNGESWFLEACLLMPYQIEEIKNHTY